MKELIICEKNIAARRIAYILSDGKAKRAVLYGVPYYYFDDKIVIGLKGHIKNLDFPKEYLSWEKIEPKKLIEVEPIKKLSQKRIAMAIKKIAKDIKRVIIATDYDREGELIGVEILDLLPKNVEIKRARFSAITPNEIKKAFENLEEIDFNLAKSAEARQYIDLIWGASLTRFISLASEQLGKDFLSVGRVQSPTLALIVEREKEIQNFVPKPFWKIKVVLAKNNEKFEAEYPEKIWDEKKANEIYEAVKKESFGIVEKFEKKIEESYPPPPFDTTSFLKEASSLGISAPQAMKIAEELYMNGLISYPRTDNTVYPPLPFKAILNKLAKVFPREVEEVFKMLRKKPVAGKKYSKDHPPIHPVDAGKLDGLHAKIYELIARRFMATLSKNATLEKKKAIVKLANVNFEAKGQIIKEKNWMKVYPVRFDEKYIPDLEKGEKVRVIEIKKIRDETKPPKRYTQGSLIVEMEKLGLGTKATRHEIIGKLYQRNYIRGKQIKPTPSAFAVVDALKKGAEIITKPDMTAELEKEMDEIAEGKKNFEEVVEESKEILKKAFEILEANEEKIGDEIKKALTKQNFFGKCNKCGGELTLLKSSKGKRFIGCSNFPKCSNSYPLPQKGSVYFSNEYCKKCGAPIITIIYKGKKWKKCANINCN
ncbi:MAG: DNA topoisomerase I [Thermoplasmata archaeon]|nr:DNA topoisomerase I [Thermoplasmata archaeon]